MKITNNTGISLSLAVWLIDDNYDHIDKENYISATTLMKPLKQIILANRVPKESRTEDVEDYIARGLGNSIHNAVEHAWTHNYGRSLSLLGYPQSIIERIKINPDPNTVTPNDIPIYMEQRGFREVNIRGRVFTVGGKFDLVAEGHVEDYKSTSAFNWLFGTRDEEHQLQGSLYRWIDAILPNPRITEEYIRVNYIFTDWQKIQAKTNPKYPQKRVLHKDIPLKSLSSTNDWVEAKLTQLVDHYNLPEDKIPECTDEELWRSAPQFKYYSDPTKTDGRATRNFDDRISADKFMREEKGGKGIIITKPGEVKRCSYCAAFEVCKQKDRYFS